MSKVQDYPYDTRLNVLHGALEVIDEKTLSGAHEPWFNQTLCQVNSSVVRVGVIQGEYHWHKHDNDDEFFYVLEGRLVIDLEGRIVDLQPRQGFHFARLFKAAKGVSPFHFVTRTRMERAKQLLRKTRLPIFEIAERVGYQKPSHFSARFRAVLGCGPAAYRESSGR
jgi:hypothetical protein